eukprot:1160155-Pelagomonas_calceolata.AAC.6
MHKLAVGRLDRRSLFSVICYLCFGGVLVVSQATGKHHPLPEELERGKFSFVLCGGALPFRTGDLSLMHAAGLGKQELIWRPKTSRGLMLPTGPHADFDILPELPDPCICAFPCCVLVMPAMPKHPPAPVQTLLLPPVWPPE